MNSGGDDYVDLAKQRLDWAEAGIDRLEELVDSFLATNPSQVVTSRPKH